MAQGLSTDELLRYNSLQSYCNNFPAAGMSLCIPSLRVCKAYTVQSADTCKSLQKQFGITYAQLSGWNPSLDPKCNNIARSVGFAICVSAPGGAWVNPNPGETTKTSRPSDPPIWTATLKPMDSYPIATFVPSSEVAPYANGTRMDCPTYVTAPILTNYTLNNGTTSFACDDAAKQFGISLETFLEYNPSLNGSSPCLIANYTQYCVQTIAKVSSGIVGACVETDISPTGFDCNKFVSSHGLDKDQFLLWNPEVGSNCENFTVGTHYCVTVLHYKQPGMLRLGSRNVCSVC